MANRIPLESICAKKVPTLSPKYDGLIDYVDISSVDNTEKRIVSIQCISAKEAPSRAKQLLEAGDILVSTVRPNLNAVAMVEQPTNNLLVGSTGYCILRCNDSVDKRYVFHFCQSPYFVEDMTSQATGASYPAVSAGIVKSSTIPDHPIEKQKEIADRLDRISELIALRKEQLAKLDQLVKSRFIELFGDPETNPKGWEQLTVGDVCASIVRGPFGSALKKEFFVSPSDNTYKVYEQKHAIQKSATIGSYYVTAEKYNELRRFECRSGDILMSCSGTMGELYQLPAGCERGIINQALCKFTLNERILPIVFLVYMRETIGNLETKGSGIQNIAAVSYVKAMPINLPPMDVQEQFAAFVEQTDKSKLAIQQSLDKLETLKKSLMQEYFSANEVSTLKSRIHVVINTSKYLRLKKKPKEEAITLQGMTELVTVLNKAVKEVPPEAIQQAQEIAKLLPMG